MALKPNTSLAQPAEANASHRQPRARKSYLLRGAVVAVFILSLIPLLFVLYTITQTSPKLLADIIWRPKVGQLLFNTLALIVLAVPIMVLVSLVLGFLVQRTDLPGRNFWRAAFSAPLAIPAFVNAYAWVSLLPSIGGLSGGVLVTVLSYTPLIFVPVAATAAGMDATAEDVAASLGHSPLRRFFSVYLPLMRLPIAGGALLTALHLLSEYGAFAMMRFDTFTTVIMGQFQSTFASQAANALAAVLVAFCMLLLLVDLRIRKAQQLARSGSGAARTSTVVPLGKWKLPAILVCALWTALSVLVPLGVVARWLWKGGAAVWDTAEVSVALSDTLTLACAGALLTLIATWPVAYLAARSNSWGAQLAERSAYVSASVPSIVVALALVMVAINFTPWMYQQLPVILIGYVILLAPRALVTLRAGLGQIPVIHEDLARLQGRGPLRAWLATTARLALPSSISAFGLVFLGIVNELTLTLILAPTGWSTLATQFWVYTGEIDYRAAAPYALLMILLSAPMAWLVDKFSPASEGQI